MQGLNIDIVDLTYFELVPKGANRGSRLLQICKYWSGYDNRITVISSKTGIRELKEQLHSSQSLINFKEIPYSGKLIRSRANVIVEFVKRIFLMLFINIPKSTDVIYTLTGLLPDVFFAFLQKVKNPHIKWVANIDNLVWHPWKRPGWKKINNFFIYLFAWLSFIVNIKLIRNANLIFTVSNFVTEGLISYGLSRDKIEITSNGIAFEEILLNGGGCDKIFDSVYLGRIDIPKGILDLVDIWHIVCKQNKRYKLAIIGGMTDVMEKGINKKVLELGLKDNIELLGFRGGSEKFKILNKGKTFAYPSYDESFGQSVMEACACGLPVIAYDLAAYRFLYPENLIQIVPLRRVDLFAEKVLFLLREDKLRKDLADWGREVVKYKTWDNILKRELSIVDKLVKR